VDIVRYYFNANSTSNCPVVLSVGCNKKFLVKLNVDCVRISFVNFVVYCSCVFSLVCLICVITFAVAFASGEGIVSLGVGLSRCHAECVSAALVLAAKVMRCIQRSEVNSFYFHHFTW